jgi:hypothetical protein
MELRNIAKGYRLLTKKFYDESMRRSQSKLDFQQDSAESDSKTEDILRSLGHIR